MSGKTINVVVGDLGGWKFLEKPLQLALEQDCEVTVGLFAGCALQYREGNLKFDERIALEIGELNEDWFEHFLRNNDLTVVGASQSREGMHAAVLAMCSRAAIILAVEDMYGSIMPALALARDRLQRNGRSLSEVVHRLCVIDEFARELIFTVYPELRGRVTPTGGPHFDKLVEMKGQYAERRQDLRHALGVSEDQPVFLIAGGKNGTPEMLLLVREALKICGLSGIERIVVRPHPSRSSWHDRLLVREVMARMDDRCFVDAKESFLSSDDLLPGVDFVLTPFSTTGHSAILLEMPGTVFVGSGAIHWDLWQEKKLRRPLQVEAGAAWYVDMPDEPVKDQPLDQAAQCLADVIRTVFFGRNIPGFDSAAIAQVQARLAGYNDGRAAERVWNCMHELLGKPHVYEN